MRHWRAVCLAATTILMSSVATAFFHTFEVEQVFSTADGSIQFVIMTTTFNGENLSSGVQFSSTDSVGDKKVFTFTKNLPSAATAGKRILIATQSFAALGLVTPDFVIPDQFIPTGAGSVGDAFSMLAWSAGELPTDGVNALYVKNNVKSVKANLATNFAGQTGSVIAPPPALSFQGIWWAAPAMSESGWGLNVAHQGDTIFASWFTYDLTGHGWWLVMTANKTGPNTYTGQLFETTGPAFNSVPFLPSGVIAGPVGTGTLTFTDSSIGTFDYTVQRVSMPAPVHQIKTIVRQVFGTLPVCTFGTQPNLALATNYQDIWWKFPAASESGWGINLNHQSDTIFATWFTYDVDGTPLWLVVTALKTGPGVYTGDLYRTTGPAFNAVPFNPAMVVATKVGTATFTFTDGNSATFHYDITGVGPAPVSQSKSITREVFTAPGTTCQ